MGSSPDRDTSALVAANVAGLADLYAAGRTSPLEVFETYLTRIDETNKDLCAFVHIDRVGGRLAAEQSTLRWRTGSPLSAVDGAPIAIKANIAVAGWPWTAGVGAYAGRIASHDADCVAALRAAGAILIGVANMHEAALGATTDNPWYGRTHNPAGRHLTPGGSSGGSAAAVGGGLCAAALGTDTIGSIRIPAAYCGVFGYKPDQDLISSDGVTPLSPSFDTVGVLGRTAGDCRLVAEVAARARIERRYQGLAGARIALLDWGDELGIESALGQSFAETVSRARAQGATVEPISLPDYDFRRVQRLMLMVAEIEGSQAYREALQKTPEGFSPGLRTLLDWGTAQPKPVLTRTLLELKTTALRIRQATASFHAVLSPTMTHAAFDADQPPPSDQAAFTALASALRRSATAFPIGVSTDGRPLSAQVMARSEDTCLSLAGLLSGLMAGVQALPP